MKKGKEVVHKECSKYLQLGNRRWDKSDRRSRRAHRKENRKWYRTVVIGRQTSCTEETRITSNVRDIDESSHNLPLHEGFQWR